MTNVSQTYLMGETERFTFTRYLLLATVILMLFAAYWNMGGKAISGWTTSQKNFAIVIFGISAFMAYSRRRQLLQAGNDGNLLLGSSLLFLGTFLLVAGEHTGTDTLVQISFFLTLTGVFILLGGTGITRILVLPLIYLVFAFPIPGMVMDRFSGSFQFATAALAEIFLRVGGFTVFRDKYMIFLPHINLEVAKVCSGSHHVISLVGLALPIAFFTQKRTLLRIIIIVSGFLIGILANGVRVALIGVWTSYNNQLDIHGPFNTLLISTFVVGLGSVFLVMLANFLRRFDSKKDALYQDHRISRHRGQTLTVGTRDAVVAIVILVITVVHVHLLTPRPVSAALQPDRSLEISGWETLKAPPLFNFNEELADQEIYTSLKNPEGDRLTLYVGYFSRQTDDKDFFRPKYSLGNLAAFRDAANKRSQPWASSTGNVQEVEKSFRIYRYYLIDDVVTMSSLEAKFRIAINSVFRLRNNGAIAVILTNSSKRSWENEEFRLLLSGVKYQ